MTIPLATRKRIAQEISWVTKLTKARQCDGKGGRCLIAAQWKFRALKHSFAKDGTYCWHHLFSNGFYYDHIEEARLQKWFAKHYPNGIK